MYNSGIGTPYWFEWEIGILECLNMLQDTSIESVILQSTDFQALDDVVVNYSDKSILNIQVKHTDEDANFTYSFLASGKKPLLNELALEWKNNKDNYNFKGIQIVTNKKWVRRKQMESVQWMTLFPRCFHAYKIIIIILRQSLMSRRLSNGTEKIWR